MLSKRGWGNIRILLLTLAIISQISIAVTFGNINEDETYSIGEANSFLQGKGFTLSPIKAPDLGKIQYLHTLIFPIGMPFLYAGLQTIGLTPGLADFALDVLAILLFFTFWFIILEQLGEHFPHWIQITLWVFWILFPAPLMAGAMTGHTADLLSIALFSGNLAFLILGYKNPPKLLIYSLLSGICMGLAAMFKYVFWPALAISPLTLFVMAGLVRADWRKYILAGLVTATVGALFLAGMMLESWEATGHLYGYIYTLTGKLITRWTPAETLLWSQVGMATPIPSFALGLTPFSFYAIRNLKLIPLALVGDRYAWIYSSFVLGVLFTISGWVLFRFRKKVETDRAFLFFIISGLVTTLWVLGWQVWLSISYQATDYIGGWVPLMDIRYSSPVFPFLFLGFLLALTQATRLKKNWLKYSLTIILALSLIYPTFIALRSRANIIEKQISFGLRLRAQETFASRSEDLRRIIETIPASNDPVVVLFPDSDKDYTKIRQSVFLLGVPGLVLPKQLVTTRPVNIVLLYQQSLPSGKTG